MRFRLVMILLIISGIPVVTACAPASPGSARDGDRSSSANDTVTRTGEPVHNTTTLDPPILIDRIMVTDKIDEDDAPADLPTIFSRSTDQLYLTVQTREMTAGSQLMAVWHQDGEEIGRSVRNLTDDSPEQRWYALEFRPDNGFANGKISVHLFVDDREIDSILAQVGSAQAVARAAPNVTFALDWSPGTGTVTQATTFENGIYEVVAILRNPPRVGSDLTANWYIDDTLFTQLGADLIQSPSVRTFRLNAAEPLPPGLYRVNVVDGDEVIASNQFVVEPPYEEPVAPAINGLVITNTLGGDSSAPGPPVTETTTPMLLHAVVDVENLLEEDLVAVAWYRSGEPVEQAAFSGQELDAARISFDYELPAETEGDVTYRVTATLNEEMVAEQEFVALGGDTDEPE